MSVASPRLFLVRHGDAEGASGRAIGHTDVPLSALGAEGVRRLADDVTNVRTATIVSSDLLRARGTAVMLAKALDIPSDEIASDPRLREMHFGEWEGQRWDEIHARDRARLDEWMGAWTECRTPAGEGYPQLHERVAAWATDYTSATSDAIVVAHAGSIRALLVHLLGLTAAQSFQMRLDYAHVTAIALRSHGEAHGAELLYLNADRFQHLSG
ncbi:MAG: phosphoglycerate mutase family [Gemmatimonadetes bacterium]|nr:phosphoglycerate mutase family [Gemmatimonadota bacterium]